MIKLLREFIPNLKDRFSLAALFAILIYAIIQTLFLEREPTIYSYILIIFVSIIFLTMLWLVDPSVKPKDLPELMGRSVSFVGKMNRTQDVYKKIAELLGANAIVLSSMTEFAIVGSNPKLEQELMLKKFYIRQVSEKEWLDWVDKDVNRRLWIKRLYLKSRINKIQNPKPPKPFSPDKKVFKLPSWTKRSNNKTKNKKR